MGSHRWVVAGLFTALLSSLHAGPARPESAEPDFCPTWRAAVETLPCDSADGAREELARIALIEAAIEAGTREDLQVCRACPEMDPSELHAIALEGLDEEALEAQFVPPAAGHLSGISRGICLIVPYGLVQAGKDGFEVTAAGRELPLVAGIRDTVQVIEGIATGFRARGRYIFTVGHLTSCGGEGLYRAIFGFTEDALQGDKFVFPPEQVVEIECRAASVHTGELDWSVLEASTDIDPGIPELGGWIAPANGCSELYVLGHPFGMPLQQIGPGSLLDPADPSANPRATLWTDLYTFDMMSGSPVFQEGRIVGIHRNTHHCYVDGGPICPTPPREVGGPEMYSCTPRREAGWASSAESPHTGAREFVLLQMPEDLTLAYTSGSREGLVSGPGDRYVEVAYGEAIRIYYRERPGEPFDWHELGVPQRPFDTTRLEPGRTYRVSVPPRSGTLKEDDIGVVSIERVLPDPSPRERN